MRIQSPVCMYGYVIPIARAHTSPDGATHLFLTMDTKVRLKARNEYAYQALEKFEKTEIHLHICGYWIKSAEPDHLSVFFVSELEEVEIEDYSVFAIKTNSPPKRCQILPNDAINLGIFSRVFGPASEQECEDWMEENRGIYS